MPFGIFNDTLPVYLRVHGVSLGAIGAMSLLQLPWSLKVLWSPWVDRLGTPRRWIMACLLVAAGVLAWLSVQEATVGVVWGLPLAAALLLLTTSSATQDVAIDGYFVRLLQGSEQGTGNGLRVSAYRAAMIVGGGGIIMLSDFVPWTAVFAIAAMLLGTLALSMTALPTLPQAAAPTWADWAHALLRWLKHPGALGAFAFILLYKLGDASMGAMVKPFWVDRGMSLTEIGFLNTTAGIFATVSGAVMGGRYATRVGTFKALWVLGIAQAISNLGYACVAYFHADKGFLYAASVSESFTGGLGTAAELTLLTRLCDKEHAATQFAALTALFGLTRALAGAASGLGVEAMGFASYFALTFFLSFPAYAFLPAVKRRLKVTQH